MTHSNRPFGLALRDRILGIVGTSVFLATACGGTTDPGSGKGNLTGSGGSGGATQTSCLTMEEVQSECASGAHGCSVSGGLWSADAGALTECPEFISDVGTCGGGKELTGLQDGECCYQAVGGYGGCGRPFLVGSEARQAPTRSRSDWLAPLVADREELDPTSRRAIANAWLEDARLEHASVASFARFTLELLALGAPAKLLADAQRAAADEVEHARSCFALASHYAGEAFGPGSLSLAGSDTRISLEDAAARAVREGCVGETLAAIVAREQLEHARTASARHALERIARDEAAHAELAWRFVKWAVEQGGASVERAVNAAFADAIATIRAAAARPELDVDLVTFAAHGRLGRAHQRRVELQALLEVVEPCARGVWSPM
jgi:hypothetical protein